ncbi:MAG: hypothetical protein LUI14_02115 [Lachnospiraceae bacterium]|nr:hypothetical protein [Lachnospiraceae bacterium]
MFKSSTYYHTRLRDLGNQLVSDLDGADNRAALQRARDKQAVKDGLLTEKAYKLRDAELVAEREAILKAADDAANSLIAEYNAATDEAHLPSASRVESGFVEILKNFDLDSDEFNSMVDLYKDKPVMLRLLDSYRENHPELEIKTDFRYQSASDKKAAFAQAVNTCMGVAKNGVFSPQQKQEHIVYHAAKAFHSVQGNPDGEMPIPPTPEALQGNAGTSVLF